MGQKRLRRFVTLGIACVSAATVYGASPSLVYAAVNDQIEQTVGQDKAKEELDQAKKNVEKDTAQAVRPDKVTVPVTSVSVEGTNGLDEDAIRTLVPELNKKQINIHELSKQIQLLNDTGAAKVGATFVSNQDGTFAVKVANEDKKHDKYGISFSNTGNEYSGDWRTTLSYVNNNTFGHADTFGAAFITSPDNHFSDVKMGAVSYRTLLPKANGALTFNASIYDINQDEAPIIVTSGLINSQSAGKGFNTGLHYQHYLAYTSREKDIIDFGIDYRSVRTDGLLTTGPATLGNQKEDYNVKTASLSFLHNNRDTNHSLSYNVGIVTNFGGSDASYNRNWAGPGFGRYDDHFVLYQGGVNYQIKSKSDWIFGARMHGQYTTNNLVGLMQIGAGGMNTVRGFSNSISADTGVVGSVEVFTPEFVPNSRFVVFSDYGNLTNNRDRAAFHCASLASVGIGYRYTDTKHGITLAIDYAKVVNDLDSTLTNTNNHKRWNVMLNMSF